MSTIVAHIVEQTSMNLSLIQFKGYFIFLRFVLFHVIVFLEIALPLYSSVHQYSCMINVPFVPQQTPI